MEKLKTTLILSLSIIVAVMLFKCENKTIVHDNVQIDSLFYANREKDIKIAYITSKIDSIKSIEPKLVIKYRDRIKSNRDSIIVNICDTVEVLKYYDSSISSCDSIISIKDTLNRLYSSKIAELKEAYSNEQQINKEYLNSINMREKAHKKEKRKSFVRGLGIGILAALATVIIIK